MDSHRCASRPWGGRESVVRMLLLRKDVDVNGRCHPEEYVTSSSPIFQAVQGKYHSVLRQLLEHPKIELVTDEPSPVSALFLAVTLGDECSVRILLEDGRVDVNHGSSFAYSPVGIAVLKRNAGMLRLLLSDRNARLNRFDTDYVSVSGRHRYNAFLGQALFPWDPNVEIVELLMQHPQVGIHPDVLHHAVNRVQPHLPTIELLLRDERVQVNFRSGKGYNTPLIAALMVLEGGYVPDFLAAVRLLIGCERVDVNLPDDEGHTPLVLMVEAGRVDRVKLLLERKDLIVEEENLISMEQARSRGGNAVEIRKCLDEFLEERRRRVRGEEPVL
ncbi:ankyrin [Choiromyces venosus 120613-1]|uniref:Ankyrin n=1 Tax=Choiromyces venosus 120613-1 TaxID=1336337 RepID=A0A3N4JCI8_9PEZI|nr:ankyrin [Choiromyces venosus 120613-1]